MKEDLVEYIKNNVFPEYQKNEKGHGMEHISLVIENSFRIKKKLELELKEDMIFVIAAYHDIGCYIDRENHEKVSGQIFIEDNNMKKWFSEEERQIIKEAIEDHRASSHHEPRSLYGKLISTADRAKLEIDTCIKRAQSYTKEYMPNYTREQQLERMYQHLSEKYGENGYAKVYLQDDVFDSSIKELRETLKDKEEFFKRAEKIIDEMENS